MFPTDKAPLNANPFRSFWMAGYECTDQLNAFGNRVDFVNVTGHLSRIKQDYRNLSLFNIETVREGIRWSRVEKRPYEYDWSDVELMMAAAEENNIQQVWDLCHFGFPDDLTPLHPMFARRFAALCRAFVLFCRSRNAYSTLIVTPFNEVSFISWLGGDVCGTSPYCTDQGWRVKYQMMKAYIEGIEAMKEIDPSVRIMATEPLVNIVPPLDADTALIIDTEKKHDDQFQVLDMLSGRICPELRGRPEYIDIVGCNYYYNNQWEVTTNEYLPWLNEKSDPRWLPPGELMKQLFERYRRPVVLSETSHPGDDRASWLGFITDECCKIIEQGYPLWGVCWYPAIDRPDWDHLAPWHHAGIWDVDTSDDQLKRILDLRTAHALHEAQKNLKGYGSENKLLSFHL